MSECLKLIDDANNGVLNDETLEKIIEELQDVKRAREASIGLENVEKEIFNHGEYLVREAEIAKKVQRRDAYRNILIERKGVELAIRADKAVGNPSLGLEAVLVGVNAPFQGSLRSIDSLINTMGGQYFGGLVADLSQARLLTKFDTMKGDFEKEVTIALGNLNTRNPKPASELRFEGNVDKKISADAQKLAEIMYKYQRAVLLRENKAGAYIRLKEDRVVRVNHDSRRMTDAGMDAWVQYMMDEKVINWRKTARGDFYIDLKTASKEAVEKVQKARIEFLERSYKAITTGVRIETDVKEVGVAFTGPQNIAKARSASAVFTFKNPEAWYNYDQNFGRASLREAFVQDLQGSMRSIALMEQLGTNPREMFKRIQKRLLEMYRDDPKKVKQLRREGSLLNFEAMLDEVTGDVNIGSHTPIARWMHGYRAVQTMSKLGGAAIAAFSDVAFMASNRIYQGRSLMDAWGDSLTAVFKGMSKGEMREFADRLGVGFESQIGEFMSRFNAADDIPGQTSKLLNTFFKLNLLQPWTEANKRGVTLMIANDLAREAGKKFDDLPEDLRRLLGLYDIDAKKWENVRQGVAKGPDGREYIVPGEIPDESVRENVFNLLTNEAEFSVPSPGARERAILRQGYRPGSFAGEAIRFVGQFKSFGVLGLTKNVGRHMYGTGAKNYREAFARGLGGNLGLVNTIVGTTALGYMVMQAKEIMKGREPRPATAETFFAAALQGGGLGIYGDFLFGQANRYGGGTLETLAGPGIGTAADALDLVQRFRFQLATGDEDVRGDLIRLIKSNTPLANLFYTQQALDYMVWYQLQETINPGYLSRMEDRVRRDNDQEFFIPPSSIVAPGGGFR